jgi:hypothetical protein
MVRLRRGKCWAEDGARVHLELSETSISRIMLSWNDHREVSSLTSESKERRWRCNVPCCSERLHPKARLHEQSGAVEPGQPQRITALRCRQTGLEVALHNVLCRSSFASPPRPAHKQCPQCDSGREQFIRLIPRPGQQSLACNTHRHLCGPFRGCRGCRR